MLCVWYMFQVPVVGKDYASTENLQGKKLDVLIVGRKRKVDKKTHVL